ncbi:MAG: bacillithiol biosynthesis cysteine-adding enzyme BshC [Clostridiales bacterium]|nr:bacillithiol biosynthesis cysteine-adding enzyme BshC [Clostridiales bacterium]
MTVPRLWPAPALFPGGSPSQEVLQARLKELEDLWPTLLKRPSDHRRRLAEALLTYQRDVGAGQRAREAARSLADPKTLVVVTGQQIGLFTGPAYTVYKALTAVLWARRLEESLQRPVVPVFWVATEDHDYREATRVMAFHPEKGMEPFGLPPGPLLRSVGLLPIPPSAEVEVDRFLRSVPHEGDWLENLLRETLSRSRNLGQWFARQMAQLFADEPLVFLDPMDPELRSLAAPALSYLMEGWARVRSGLLETTEEIRQRGETPQLSIDPESLQLFRYHQGKRLLLLQDGEEAVTRNGNWRVPLKALPEIIAREPEKFSPAAALRPLVQDYLLPTLAQVAGPGELRYLPQLEGAYKAAGWSRAVTLPRLSFTLLWPEWEEKAKGWGLDLDHLEDWHGVRFMWERSLLSRHPYPLDEAFARAREDLHAVYRRLGEDLQGLGEGFARLLEGNKGRVLGQVDYLEAKAHQHLRRRYREEYREWQRWMEALRPLGRPQERVYSFLSLMGPFGPGGIRAFFRAVRLDHPHQWVLLGKAVPCS